MTNPNAGMRDSDRWITPRVIVAGLLVAGFVICAITAGMVYLASIDKDPDPVLRMIGEMTTAISALGALVLQLWNRVTTTKVETHAGTAASGVEDVKSDVAQVRSDVQYIADSLELAGRHAADAYPPTMERGTAPAVPGS